MSEKDKDAFGILSDSPEVVGDTEYHTLDDDSSSEGIFGKEIEIDESYLSDDIEVEEDFDDEEFEEEDEEGADSGVEASDLEDTSKEEEEEEEEDEEYEQEEEKQEEDEEVEVENPLLSFVKDWKDQGYIPEDLEIKDDITDAELSDILYRHKSNSVNSAVKNEVRQELMEEYGLTDPEVLETARRLHYGVQDEDLLQLDTYAQLAQVQLDSQDESADDQFVAYAAYYYQDNGVPPDKAEKLAKIDLEEESFNEKVQEYNTHFRNRYAQFEQSLQQRQAYERQRRQQELQEYKEKVDNYLSEGRVGGKEYTDDQIDFIKEALNEKKYWVPDGRGGKVKVTYYDKKRLEYETNEELLMKGVFDFILEGEKGLSEVDRAREEGRRQVFKKLRKPKKAVKRKRNTKRKIKTGGDSEYGKEVATFEY